MKAMRLILLCVILTACEKESPVPNPWIGKCGDRTIEVKFENNRPVEVYSNGYKNEYTYLSDSIIHKIFDKDGIVTERHDYSLNGNKAVFSVDSHFSKYYDDLRMEYHYSGDTLEVEGFLLGSDSSVYFEYYVQNLQGNLEYFASGYTNMFDASGRTEYEYGNEPNNGVFNVRWYYILGIKSPNLPVKANSKFAFYKEDITHYHYQFDEQQRLTEVKNKFLPGYADEPTRYSCTRIKYE